MSYVYIYTYICVCVCFSLARFMWLFFGPIHVTGSVMPWYGCLVDLGADKPCLFSIWGCLPQLSAFWATTTLYVRIHEECLNLVWGSVPRWLIQFFGRCSIVYLIFPLISHLVSNLAFNLTSIRHQFWHVFWCFDPASAKWIALGLFRWEFIEVGSSRVGKMSDR
jgi:hypothetical protein